MVDALGTWGARWLEVAPEHFDAHVVLWSLCRHAEPDEMPAPAAGDPVRLCATARGGASGSCSLRRSPRSASSRPASTRISSCEPSSEWLAKWHMGRISLGQAMHEGLMAVEGPRDLVQTLAGLGLSRF